LLYSTDEIQILVKEAAAVLKGLIHFSDNFVVGGDQNTLIGQNFTTQFHLRYSLGIKVSSFASTPFFRLFLNPVFQKLLGFGFSLDEDVVVEYFQVVHCFDAGVNSLD